jgi:antitoxin VapB
MMKNTAKIFASGRSQAVRLPKDFRFQGSEVYIRKERGRVILSEKPQKAWAQIFNDFNGDPDFSVHRESLKCAALCVRPLVPVLIQPAFAHILIRFRRAGQPLLQRLIAGCMRFGYFNNDASSPTGQVK